jgi:outer membrane protein with beta-barrel domain
MRKLLVVSALLAFSGAAWGQAGDFWVNVGESLFQNSGIGTDLAFGGSASDIKLDSGYRFGFRFDFNVGDHYGAEIGYAFNHTDLVFNNAAGSVLGLGGGTSLAMHMHQVAFNGMYYPFTPDKARIRPFVTAGFGFDNFVPPGGQSYSGETKIAANFGGGVKAHIGEVHGMKVGVRVDLREYISPHPNFGIATGGNAGLWQTEISAGIGIGF